MPPVGATAAVAQKKNVVPSPPTHHAAALLAKTSLALASNEDSTPSGRLAKQLIGQLPIQVHDASVSLNPYLVQETSDKLRAALNEMVEAAVVEAKNELEAAAAADVNKLTTLVQELEMVRGMAEERVLELQERDSTRNGLLEKLRVDAELMTALNLELEQHRKAGTAFNNNSSNTSVSAADDNNNGANNPVVAANFP